VTSSNATLTVRVPPSITSQPQSVRVTAPNPASFTVVASGSEPLSYQWQRNGTNLTNGVNLSGCATPTLNVNPTGLNEAGIYVVIVRNAYGQTASLPALLTMGVPPSCRISSLVPNPDGSVTIHFVGGPGYAYLVQATTNLGPPALWGTVGADIAGTNGLWQFTDPNASHYRARVYRSAVP
jgi:hypothetical protein